MKYLILSITVLLYFSSCKTCDPATWDQRTKFRSNKSYGFRQWMKQRNDGYWIVTTVKGFKDEKKDTFECKPDSIQLAQL
jgi:hypothetical protein